MNLELITLDDCKKCIFHKIGGISFFDSNIYDIRCCADAIQRVFGYYIVDQFYIIGCPLKIRLKIKELKNEH